MNAPRQTLQAAAFDEAYFNEIASVLDGLVQPREVYLASAAAETSDFVRFNRGKVRQPGSVTQCHVDVQLIHGARHASERVSLSGDPHTDRAVLGGVVDELRAILPHLAEDPHLLYATEPRSTRHVQAGAIPAAEGIVDEVLRAAEGHDLVGIYAGGTVSRAFASSFGQRNWHEATSFDLQWSLYHRADKAVKGGWAGLDWSSAELTRRMQETTEALALVARPSRAVAPGHYRAYLTPAAMEEVLSLLHWSGFSGRALATKQSSLQRLQEGSATLAPDVTLTEATVTGIAPAFQGDGFVRPEAVTLIDGGKLVGSLVSPRSAREFGSLTNAANGAETPESLAMTGGTLPSADVLAALDTGLYIGNLWYLNYSDRPACRMTGMTRFATFWVEGGRIVAPIDVLRFDDTLYRMLGSSLDALTRETELRLDANTYEQRSLASMRLPGALLSDLQFTL